MDNNNKLITSEEVARRLFVSKSTLQIWRKEKEDFPLPIQIGRRVLWKESDIDAYIESKQISPSDNK